MNLNHNRNLSLRDHNGLHITKGGNLAKLLHKNPAEAYRIQIRIRNENDATAGLVDSWADIHKEEKRQCGLRQIREAMERVKAKQT